ncbi:MAG: HEAT repeat domain-containing protein [Alphaproteobacteria bacterium GM7ARS4]|nr:HEAT repeat domain-containing protein [Alphaproteobacteria bacterium GM7ARS4]
MFIESQDDDRKTLFILENLGRLPKPFDGRWVFHLLKSDNKNIRLHAVKTLGKSGNVSGIEALWHVAQHDESTDVRREAVSSLGRLRSIRAIDALAAMVSDVDPKVVSQAIRGLLVFKGDRRVDSLLTSLRDHENETIQDIIKRAYAPSQSASHDRGRQRHAHSHTYLRNVVVLGDVRSVLEHIEDESFHLTFTSPPYYNARDYALYASYKAYLSFLRDVFRATYDKTKEGRFLIVNTSPVIVPRVSRQHASKRYPIPFDVHAILVGMGWEFIDDIIWVKPEASVKNRNAGFLQHRKPLAYKPNPRTEYVMVYRKRTDKLIDWNIKQYGREVIQASKVRDGYETSNLWQIDPTYDKVHSAVFPVALCERVIRYYSFAGDLVFDPFGGSGTFGRAAQALGRYFFLTEKDGRYFDYMKSSMAKDEQTFFAQGKTRFCDMAQFKKLVP